MILERVIGNTIKGKHGMTIDPTTGDLAYIAGCVVVFYRPKNNRQTQFLSSLNNRFVYDPFCCIDISITSQIPAGRPLSCLDFSSDGRHLAAGEGTRQPSVILTQTSQSARKIGSPHTARRERVGGEWIGRGKVGWRWRGVHAWCVGVSVCVRAYVRSCVRAS